MREHVIWNGENFDEVKDFVSSGVKYSESIKITNGVKKENKLLFILDEDSNWVPVEEGSYIWKNDNDTFYITDELPDEKCDYENDNDEETPDCENCEYKDDCEDYEPTDDYDLDEEDEEFDDEDGDEGFSEDDEDYNYDEDENYTEAEQKRIDFFEKEIEELRGKITKIDNLMMSAKWETLSDMRKVMIEGQKVAMGDYLVWLAKRLDWEKKHGE